MWLSNHRLWNWQYLHTSITAFLKACAGSQVLCCGLYPSHWTKYWRDLPEWQCPTILLTSYSWVSSSVLLDSDIVVRSPISGDDSSYFFKWCMLKMGNPGYLSLIHSLKTFGLIFCWISKGPIHRCFSFSPTPFKSIQSNECGLTRTLLPCLKSGTGHLPLLNWSDCSSWASNRSTSTVPVHG